MTKREGENGAGAGPAWGPRITTSDASAEKTLSMPAGNHYPCRRRPTLDHPLVRLKPHAEEPSGSFPPIARRCRPLVRRARCFVVRGAGQCLLFPTGFLLSGLSACEVLGAWLKVLLKHAVLSLLPLESLPRRGGNAVRQLCVGADPNDLPRG